MCFDRRPIYLLLFYARGNYTKPPNVDRFALINFAGRAFQAEATIGGACWGGGHSHSHGLSLLFNKGTVI